jgi:two-component sensor histidine kinase
MECVFLLLLLISGHFSIAQDFDAAREIKKIDSLIEYNRFDIAQRKANSLYRQLEISKTKKHKAQLLELKYLQALLLDRKDDASIEPLKILLNISDQAESEKLYLLSCKIALLTALSYEKADEFELTDEYLNKAYKIYKENKLDEIYSTYCVRRSSYYRLTDRLDSSFHYARQAKIYAKKYPNKKDLDDSYMLLRKELVHTTEEAVAFEIFLLKHSLELNDYTGIAIRYNNISGIYLSDKADLSKALAYNDSAFSYYKQISLMYKYLLPKRRYKLFEAMGNIDSAYYYFQKYHTDTQLLNEQQGVISTKRLKEQYDNDKKEAIIQSKNRQMILIASLLGIIAVASILLFLQNRKINARNKIINKQLAELSKALEQRKILLSELQHRVKNNLQHVISILEIQKESVDFNNIDELLRSNQNRIHAMALLHKKLNVADNVNDVDFRKYIAEVAELVKDSYDNHKKEITLNVKCEIKTISIEKALPLGLIITELVSNSMKHAFKKQNAGIITIEITKSETAKQFYYSDNGSGFDFNRINEKGLGQEIIKGLIDQLDGSIETKSNNGFELTVIIE